MAGEQKRKERKVLITKALLLGYRIEWCDVDKAYGLWDAEGKRVRERIHNSIGGGWRVLNWPARWLAAIYALKLSGVPHETNVPRDTGISSGKGARLRGGSKYRRSSKSFFEKSGA